MFEVLLEENHEYFAYRLRWRSRLFGVDRTLQLRRDWLASGPRDLVEFVRELVGGDLMNWAELGVDGRAMARAMMSHWDREIIRFMERLEEQARYADHITYGGVPPWMYATPADPAAAKKARETLLRHLNDEQKASFEKDKKFTVRGQDGKDYTITHARSFNVVGPDGEKYCGQLADCPVEDQMLAQKLLLENEPKKFFDNANVSFSNESPRMHFSDAMREYIHAPNLYIRTSNTSV